MIPQANAVLTEVKGTVAAGAAKSLDTWDDPEVGGDVTADEGGSKWAGELDCYYRETRDRVLGGQGGAADRVLMREVIFEIAALSVTVEQGDTLILTYGGATIRGRAKVVPRATLPGFPSDVQTSRVTLEAE